MEDWAAGPCAAPGVLGRAALPARPRRSAHPCTLWNPLHDPKRSPHRSTPSRARRWTCCPAPPTPRGASCRRARAPEAAASLARCRAPSCSTGPGVAPSSDGSLLTDGILLAAPSSPGDQAAAATAAAPGGARGRRGAGEQMAGVAWGCRQRRAPSAHTGSQACHLQLRLGRGAAACPAPGQHPFTPTPSIPPPAPLLPARCSRPPAPSRAWRGSAWPHLTPTATSAMGAWWCPPLGARPRRRTSGARACRSAAAGGAALLMPAAVCRLLLLPCARTLRRQEPRTCCLWCAPARGTQGAGGAAGRVPRAARGGGAGPRNPAGRRQRAL